MRQIVIAIVLFAMCGCTTAGLSSSKPKQIQTQMDVMRQLHAIAELPTRGQGIDAGSAEAAQIERSLSVISTPDSLAKCALLCHAIAFPQMAGDENYDRVFDYAMWHCLQRLAQLDGDEAATSLASLQPTIGDDGGPSLLLKELLLKQSQLKKLRPTIESTRTLVPLRRTDVEKASERGPSAGDS